MTMTDRPFTARAKLRRHVLSWLALQFQWVAEEEGNRDQALQPSCSQPLHFHFHGDNCWGQMLVCLFHLARCWDVPAFFFISGDSFYKNYGSFSDICLSIIHGVTGVLHPSLAHWNYLEMDSKNHRVKVNCKLSYDLNSLIIGLRGAAHLPVFAHQPKPFLSRDGGRSYVAHLLEPKMTRVAKEECCMALN